MFVGFRIHKISFNDFDISTNDTMYIRNQMTKSLLHTQLSVHKSDKGMQLCLS